MKQWLYLVAAVAICCIPRGSAADCATDRDGRIVCGRGACMKNGVGLIACSRFEDGDAVLTRDGRILCGRGQCQKTSQGEVFCSTVEKGAAQRDSRGDVLCEGGCERGSEAMCESTPARR